MKHHRRDFLKLTTAGATGLVLARPRLAHAAWPANGTMEINPEISNMRVVACVDPKMMKSTPTSTSVAGVNDAADWPRIQANMDVMAMQLANKDCAEDAWKTIFRSGKDWAQTVVAVKVNAGSTGCIARLAVLQKFSNIFLSWGVKPENYIVYDGNSSATNMLSSSFSTTDKNKVLGAVSAPSGKTGDLLGGFKDGKLGDGNTRKCAAKIADGTVDILINVAANKGHIMFGKATLCMKNHYGTWQPDTTHTDLNNLIFNMNKGDPIIGGDPPRQQLCFVDSLFANKGGDVFQPPDAMPCYFVMGTFAPAVDYLTVKKVREEVLKVTHDSAAINSYVTSFGYTTSDPEWILVPPVDQIPPEDNCGAGGSTGTGEGGAGGNSATGTGGAGAAGEPGTGGSGPGGRTGNTRGTGGSRAGGGPGAGGSQASGGQGSGGESGSAGASSGGKSGSGGVARGGESGGDAGSGGSDNSGGSGGSQTSSSAAAGGASGGTSGTVQASGSSSSGCEVGGDRGKASGFGVLLAFSALVGGQLRRLFLRRQEVARPEVPNSSEDDLADRDQDHGSSSVH